MDWRQKAVLTIGFILILATGLFPPWLQSWDFVAGGEDIWFQPPGARGWVTNSFRTPNDKEITGFPEIGDKKITASGMKALLNSVPGSWRARIDTTRLMIEWIIVATGVVVGVAAFAQKRSIAASGRREGDALKAG